MLTTQDLQKIQEIVIKIVVSNVNPLKDDISTLKNDMRFVKRQLKKNHDELIEKTNMILKFVEAEEMKIKSRVRRIEDHLQLPE